MNEKTRQSILVVDDHDLVRNLVVAILKRSDFVVIEAESGMQALNIYRDRGDDIACVLLDLSMPGMSGAETIVEIRKFDPDAILVIMSAHDESMGNILVEDLGAAAFLQKPFRPDDLTRLVTECVSR